METEKFKFGQKCSDVTEKRTKCNKVPEKHNAPARFAKLNVIHKAGLQQGGERENQKNQDHPGGKRKVDEEIVT